MAICFKPREYQRLIINHILTHPRCAVWAGMGMGKTVATLTAIKELDATVGVKRALILAPLRVARTTWVDEAKKWEHLKDLKVACITGTATQRANALASQAQVFTTNYENLPWLQEAVEENPDLGFDVIVCDESTRLKGFRLRQGGKRTKALAKLAFLPGVHSFVELTGTPTSNGLEDLWGQLYFIDKGKRLGRSFSTFRELFFYAVNAYGGMFTTYKPYPNAENRVLELTKDIALKLNPEDWFSLEKPIVNKVMVKLPTKARKVYDQIERDFYAEVEDGAIEASNAAVKTMKCLQVASGSIYKEAEDGWHDIHSEKLDALSSIVEEASGAPLLVTYQFVHECERIKEAFPQAVVLDKNPETIRRWNAGEIPMLLAHPASCGHGLSLQDGGNILVFFSTGWSLEQHEQIIERIGPVRQLQSGHNRPVFLHYIVAENTFDELVLKRLETKRETLDLIMERQQHG